MSSQRVLRPIRITAAAIAALYAAAAWSHAHLQQQTPAADSTQAAPQEVRLDFSEPLEAALSKIEVTDGAGKQVTANKAAVDATAPRTLRVQLGKLTPGNYTVDWNVVSTDGHRAKGSYRFTVE
ncbi:copper homeostasis periplasmic binding protein CopC [Cupriavidus sp. CuC1]|uniref:copper homeostasis periplasmic binding protein CopC n=1 Tax=Cupriavidus sp. CuC1 TaxID=3373131 RepID=UPI0037D719E0